MILNSKRLALSALVAAAVLAGCGGSDEAKPTQEKKVQANISEESLGLRKTNIYTEDETKPNVTSYAKAQPGESHKIERAYDNAPPMIPHDVEGLLPITKDYNACTGCHMPDVASSMGATPIPKTHFLNWRPKVSYDGKEFKTQADVMHSKTFQNDQGDKLYQGRYNCSQCHAPQSQGNLAVDNTFKPDYQSEEAKHRSSLLDTLNAGVQDESSL